MSIGYNFLKDDIENEFRQKFAQWAPKVFRRSYF